MSKINEMVEIGKLSEEAREKLDKYFQPGGICKTCPYFRAREEKGNPDRKKKSNPDIDVFMMCSGLNEYTKDHYLISRDKAACQGYPQKKSD